MPPKTKLVITLSTGVQILPNAVYDVQEVADILGVGQGWVRKALKLGEISYARLPVRPYIKGEWLIEFLDKHRASS